MVLQYVLLVQQQENISGSEGEVRRISCCLHSTIAEVNMSSGCKIKIIIQIVYNGSSRTPFDSETDQSLEHYSSLHKTLSSGCFLLINTPCMDEKQWSS